MKKTKSKLPFFVSSRPVALSLVAIAGLIGCSSAVDPLPSSSWTDPPWVAEQAAQREEYRAALQSCLDGKGWHVTVNLDGGIDEPLTSDEYSQFMADQGACRQSMGLSAEGIPATLDELKVNYSQWLDVRNCFIAHGVQMGPPQSEDAWLDAAQSGGGDLWLPYSDPALEALSMDEQDALKALCPQPWLTK